MNKKIFLLTFAVLAVLFLTAQTCTFAYTQYDYDCNDGLKSIGESDVDCGGAYCDPCGEGKGCDDNDDCASGLVCEDDVCVSEEGVSAEPVDAETSTEFSCTEEDTSNCGEGFTCMTDGTCYAACTSLEGCLEGYLCSSDGSSCEKDSDDDGLLDSEEATYGTDTTDTDSDDDGLNDGEEVNTYITDPLLDDTDGDGVNDGDEVSAGTDPLVVEVSGDADGDGTANTEDSDDDNDGVDDTVEDNAGTDSLDASDFPSCVDTEGVYGVANQDYKTKGTVSGGVWKGSTAKEWGGGDGVALDSCKSNTGEVLEYYCEDKDTAYSTLKSCETVVGTGYICSDGACVETDTDGDGVADSSDDDDDGDGHSDADETTAGTDPLDAGDYPITVYAVSNVKSITGSLSSSVYLTSYEYLSTNSRFVDMARLTITIGFTDTDKNNPGAASPLVVVFNNPSSDTYNHWQGLNGEVLTVETDVSTLDITLPTIAEADISSRYLMFFVADDGSVYYADPEHDGVNFNVEGLLTSDAALTSDHRAG